MAANLCLAFLLEPFQFSLPHNQFEQQVETILVKIAYSTTNTGYGAFTNGDCQSEIELFS